MLVYDFKTKSKMSFPGLSCKELIHLKDFKLSRSSFHDLT
jgi:hypothetical protein